MTELEIPSDWTFKNAYIAANFDQHVREQLPWYDLASGAAAHFARHYIGEEGLIYDIGAATGNLELALAETLRARKARLVAIDNSAEMCREYRGTGSVICADACAFDYLPADVITAFLVLMFIQYDKRSALIKHWYSALKPGGALIIFDKLEAPQGYIGTALHRLTIAGKLATGSSSEDIIRKELALSGIQRPLSPTLLAFTLPHAVEVFRFGEFAGWVIEKTG